MTKSGGVWSETVLDSFTGGSDGSEPYAGLLMDSSGALYGTTEYGGASGNGVVFKLTKSGGSWSETVLHSFTAGSNGADPQGVLIKDSKGALYGTANSGGAYGFGNVFETNPAAYGRRKCCTASPDAAMAGNPIGGLRLSGATLYGTTYFGGAGPCDSCGGKERLGGITKDLPHYIPVRNRERALLSPVFRTPIAHSRACAEARRP